MPGLHHRDPGPVGAAASDPRVTLEVIADGVHLHPEVVRLAFAAAPGRIALVTDAMAAAGARDGRYDLGSLEVDVVDSVARLASGGAIAGSTLTQDAALRRAVARRRAARRCGGRAHLDARAGASAAAATSARSRPGFLADAVLLSADLSVRAGCGPRARRSARLTDAAAMQKRPLRMRDGRARAREGGARRSLPRVPSEPASGDSADRSPFPSTGAQRSRRSGQRLSDDETHDGVDLLREMQKISPERFPNAWCKTDGQGREWSDRASRRDADPGSSPLRGEPPHPERRDQQRRRIAAGRLSRRGGHRRRRPRAAHALRRPRRVRRTVAPPLPVGRDRRSLGDVEPRRRRPRARGVHPHLPVDRRRAADRPARSAPTCSPASATPPRRGVAPVARRRSTRSTPSKTRRRATRRPPTRSTAASPIGRSGASPPAGRRCSGTPRSSR